MPQPVQYLLTIISAPESLFHAVEILRKRPAYANLELLILTPHPEQYADYENAPARVVACDYSSDEAVEAVLRPFQKAIVGVVCRGDGYVQHLRQVLPFLPPTVPVATESSLAAATNKHLMRSDFLQHFPEITPRFVRVHDHLPATVARIEAALQYPVILKPASLVSSLLVQSCHNRAQLKAALAGIFRDIAHVHKREGRRDEPRVIVEEYLEGDFFSVDAYVYESDDVQCLPPVAYIPAKQIGIDDFFLYKRFVPTTLTPDQVHEANVVVKKAIASIGLSHSTAHVELVLTAHGWKVIELGPRVGRFRHTMYRLAYDINHSLNDVLVHLGERAHVPTTFRQYVAAYSLYPEHEGVFRGITNVDFIYTNPHICYSKVTAKPGEYYRHAKNGGHALAEFIIASPDKHEYDKLVAYIEEHVKPRIEQE